MEPIGLNTLNSIDPVAGCSFSVDSRGIGSAWAEDSQDELRYHILRFRWMDMCLKILSWKSLHEFLSQVITPQVRILRSLGQ